jgi:hypothetical protein
MLRKRINEINNAWTSIRVMKNPSSGSKKELGPDARAMSGSK